MEKTNYNLPNGKGLFPVQKPELVEFLCLNCGLQGLHTATTAVEQCPKCDEKLLTLSRPQPEEVVL